MGTETITQSENGAVAELPVTELTTGDLMGVIGQLEVGRRVAEVTINRLRVENAALKARIEYLEGSEQAE
jgi:hypothetical protein